MIENLTVLEVLDKYPNSLSRAFQLNHDHACAFMQLEDPIMVNSTAPNGIQSYAKVLKIVIPTGQVIQTKLYIKKDDLIDAISLARFRSLLDEGFEKMKNSKNNTLIRSQALAVYSQIGYID